jgi:hypothetical protein
MKHITAFLISIVTATVSLLGQDLKKLAVSDNKRFLVHDDGSPFFYLADTAWELFHRLNKNQTYTYLSNRAGKGFNVVQCVLLSEINGLTEPNANGDVPLIDLDPTRPNEKYFQHVDEVVNMATSMGIYMAILPTWGSWVEDKFHYLFPAHQIFTEENARKYGKFLGSRYKNKNGIIWVVGGDRSSGNYNNIWDAMARGLREGDEGNHLITFHPSGQHSSSTLWQNASWLDFNLVQSGHASRFVNSYDFITHDYNLEPTKPVLDGETNYEDIPINFHLSNGRFVDYDVRVSSYFSVFAGGFGITYGCNNIWQMYQGDRAIINARSTWDESLDLPGAFQMRFLKQLMESRPFLNRIPDQSILLERNSTLVPHSDKGQLHMQATRDGTKAGRDATYLMVYMAIGQSVKLNSGVIPAKRLMLWWYDPRTGSAIPVGEQENTGIVETSWSTMPWHNGAGPDWVLVVDDASRNYPPPGQRIELRQ